MKKMMTVLGLVLVLALAVSPVMADPTADPNPGRGNTDVLVMNMGTSATDATAIYYNPAGTAEYQSPTNLPVNGSHRFPASAASPLGDNWRGSSVVQSAGEVAAIAEILWTNGSSSDGTTADAYTGFSTGSTVMYIPFAVYSLNSQFTLFSVQNTEANAANTRMTFINRDGATDLQTNDSIPAQGSKSYDLRNFTALQSSGFWQSNCNAGQCFWTGAVKIESTNGRKITAAATNHWTQYAAAFNGIASGANRNFVSSVERRCTNCAWNPPSQTGTWQGFSVVIAQCLSTTPCQVQIEFKGQTNTMGDLTLTKTINPGAAVGANTRAGGDFASSQFNVLRNSSDPAGQAAWAGSAIVSTLNGTEIAVVNYSLRPDINIAAGNVGVSAGNAGLQTFIPAVYKTGACDGGFNWQKLSIIRIQNPTSSNATNVSIAYYDRNGSLRYQETGLSIPAGDGLSRNTRNNCSSLGALGNNWEGSVRISSNQPLVAVAETYNNPFGNAAYGPSWAGGYNAYSIMP